MTEPRPMTAALRTAIDSHASDSSTIQALSEAGRRDGPLASLYDALALELYLSRVRQQDVLHAYEAEERSRVDAIDLEVNGPPPPVEGNPATYDPDTRSWEFK